MEKQDDATGKERDARTSPPAGNVNRLCESCANRCVQDARFVVVRCPKWRQRG